MTVCTAILKDLKLNLRIGILDSEKIQPQPVLINAKINYKPKNTLKNAVISQVYDYSKLYNHLKQLETDAHVEMLESFIWHVIHFIFQDETVLHVNLSVIKLEVFPDAHAGIEVNIGLDDYSMEFLAVNKQK